MKHLDWIKDRDPKSPGVYVARKLIGTSIYRILPLLWDGKAWVDPQVSDEHIQKPIPNPEWAKINWGCDE